MWQRIDLHWCLFRWDFGAIRLSTGTGSSSVLIGLKISRSEWSQGSALIRGNLAPEQGGVKTCRPPLTWWPLPHPSVNCQHPFVWILEASIPHLKGGVQTPRGGCGKGLRGGKVGGGGLLKGTHTNLSFKSPLLTLLPPPFILTLVYPCCGPLGHLPPCLMEAVYSAITRGPRAGDNGVFQRLSTPWLN